MVPPERAISSPKNAKMASRPCFAPDRLPLPGTCQTASSANSSLSVAMSPVLNAAYPSRTRFALSSDPIVHSSPGNSLQVSLPAGGAAVNVLDVSVYRIRRRAGRRRPFEVRWRAARIAMVDLSVLLEQLPPIAADRAPGAGGGRRAAAPGVIPRIGGSRLLSPAMRWAGPREDLGLLFSREYLWPLGSLTLGGPS